MSRANRRGIADPTTSVVLKDYDTALQEGAGASFKDGVQFGGTATYKTEFRGFLFGAGPESKVLVPGSISSDRFRDVIGAITDDDLRLMPISPEVAGRPYKASDLGNAVPVAVRGGYRFAAGDPTS